MLKNKSLEELLDLEEELKESVSNEDGSIATLISVYETLFRKISSKEMHEYQASLIQIRKQFIHYLVQYGTYLKTVYQKDDSAAELNLNKAIRYEKNLPIAYYRLGFLQYKKEKYSKALKHFQDALHFQNECEDTKYRLNPQQIYNSHLYLANCGLFIAKESKEALSKLVLMTNIDSVPKYMISPYYQLIEDNEHYLDRHAYQITTEEGVRYGTKENCEDMMDQKNMIILDLTARQNNLIFNQREVSLSKNQMEMLRYFLLKSSQAQPLTRNDFYDLFAASNRNGEIPTNTYTKNVTRLRRKLVDIGLGLTVIENVATYGETAYYYNPLYPFAILNRIDESFILGG